MYSNIPAELRALPQFVAWRYELLPGADKPTKPLYDPRTGWHAKSDDPATWVPFDVAVSATQTSSHYNGIGYVLTDNDPYTFIDLDTYDPKLSEEDRARHKAIAEAFKGYAEVSPSGNGLHLIVRGRVPVGRRRAGVEIYSAGRYMTMTGNVWRNAPIIDEQELLTTLWNELGDNIVLDTTTDKAQSQTDHQICDAAASALNKDKFIALYTGQWQQFYHSQSEADFALVDIIAYFTQNREQITRIFRASALGQRDKAKRNDYMNRMLHRAFDNQTPAVDIEGLKKRVEGMLALQPMPEGRPLLIAAAAEAPTDEIYSIPPGLVGEVAKYIYDAAPRQVPEIALCGAIGLMAGICGRSYNISGTGLNHYLLLLAPTGSGKEAMASGISMLMAKVAKAVPSATDFIGPGSIRSDAALLKYISKRSPSFVTIGGEFGLTLKQMSGMNPNSNVLGIKQVMLDLYGKSGQGKTLNPTIYSDVDKSTLTLEAPAFTFVGESAPESFYTSVDEALVTGGLLPRFTIIEYTGKQPPLNPNEGTEPPTRLVEQIAALCANSLTLNAAGKAIDVRYSPEAKQLLDAFEVESRNRLNADGNTEATRHIWNRAHLRAIKLAALISVGENPFEPFVTVASAKWAIKVSAHNTQRLLDRFEKGEVGLQNTDDVHMKEVIRIVSKYLHSDILKQHRHAAIHDLWRHKLVPYSFIQQNLAATSAFKHARMGSTPAIRTALKNLCDSGYLVQLSKMEAHKLMGTTMECYSIGIPAAFAG